MLHVNVDRYHTTNRTATTNGPISLAHAASLGKYGSGNGFTVMERISGTVHYFQDEAVPNGTPPPDLSDKQLSFVPGVLFDNHPIGNTSKFCQNSEYVQFMLFH